MAETSYYPLSPLKDSAGGTTSPSLEKPFKQHPDAPHPTGDLDYQGSRSSMFLAPSHPRPFRKGSSGGYSHFWRTIKAPLQMALFPLAAIGYLVFCYTVHSKVVPVDTYGLYTVTPQHLATIKGGVMSISIIIISITLFPVYDIISNLKSEEFFRVLASCGHGVPLETIDRISNPTFGRFDAMVAMWRHRCSNYYILGVVASLLIWIVATLAPGILTVDSVLADGELMAFAIGAVPMQSVLKAASVAWAETALDVQYSFSIENASDLDYAAYITPIPLDLSTPTSARWPSDVIGINPMCSWATTNISSPLQLPFNSSANSGLYLATAYLSDFNLDIQIAPGDFGSFETSFVAIKDPSYYVINHTTRAPATDGSTVFFLGNCQSGCTSGALVDVALDLSGTDTDFTIAFTDQTWSLAILVQPRPTGRQLMRQGNLDTIQTNTLFSYATASLKDNGGPLTGNLAGLTPLGSQLTVDLLFGEAQFEDTVSDSAIIATPTPVENITLVYTHILQSVGKAYLGGYLGTAYVPGRISASKLVFASIVLAYFRSGKGIEFTLANVAAAVHGSELPTQFAQGGAGRMGGGVYGHTDVEADGDPEREGRDDKSKTLPSAVESGNRPVARLHEDVVELWADRLVFMQRRADGSPVLHMN